MVFVRWQTFGPPSFDSTTTKINLKLYISNFKIIVLNALPVWDFSFTCHNLPQGNFQPLVQSGDWCPSLFLHLDLRQAFQVCQQQIYYNYALLTMRNTHLKGPPPPPPPPPPLKNPPELDDFLLVSMPTSDLKL